MAQATYICGIIGTGTEADPYRPSIADAPLDPNWPAGAKLNWVAAIRSDYGALVKAKVQDEYAQTCVQIADALPKCWRMTKDRLDDVLTQAEWNWLADKAQRLGITNIPAYKAGTTVLQALRWLARHWEPVFAGDSGWDVFHP